MFGRSRPVTFDPYGRRRRSGPPRWLVLLLVGIALGAAAVIVAQERYLPPRLSADASAQLRSSFERADSERARFRRELDQTGQQLATALAERQRLTDALAASRAGNAQLHDDLASVVESLPPDPRGGEVQVRAARFSTTRDGVLAYDVVLTRERGAGKPMAALMRLVVDGDSARGAGSAITLPVVPLSIGSHQVLHGSAPLPEGFRPRQSTVQVLDRSGGKALGMRVLRVERGAAD